MKWDQLLENEEASKRFGRKVFLFIAFAVLLVFVAFHIPEILDLLQKLFGVLSPFFIGLILAFVLNIFVTFFEEKLFSRLRIKPNPFLEKYARGFSVFFTLLLLTVFLSVVLLLILPEIGRSVKSLAVAAPDYIRAAQNWVFTAVEKLNLSEEQVTQIKEAIEKIDWVETLGKISNITTDFVSSVMSMTVTITSGMIRFVTGLIFSIYLLTGKESLLYNWKRVLFAFLPKRYAGKLIQLGALANRIFTGFVTGQCTEALIIGVLCYLGMSIFKMPYALLISVVVAVTSVIPIFGAYIGAIFGALILLLIRPITCLWFLIFIIVLQNLEGDLIYPKVVGNSVGLPGIWVMFAIFVCGDLFGFVGMLLGVPIFSVLYALLKTETAKRLKKKDISNGEIISVETFAEDFEKRPPKTILVEEKKKNIRPKG